MPARAQTANAILGIYIGKNSFHIVGQRGVIVLRRKWPHGKVGSTVAASPSMSGITTIDDERVADHKACPRAAQPKNGRGDLVRSPKSPNRLIPQNVFHRVRLLRQHVSNHRLTDRPWAYSIDSNPLRSVFERSTLRQPYHTVFGRTVDCPGPGCRSGRRSKSS